MWGCGMGCSVGVMGVGWFVMGVRLSICNGVLVGMFGVWVMTNICV